jgi:cysteinyl-tRNA synthetase
MLRLFDTARGEVVPLEMRDPGKVSMYVCGPTVYGPPHIGHGRQTMVYDVLRRYLEWTGVDVHHVSNVTDIDDQIINRANDEGTDAGDVARTYEGVWFGAMERLGIAAPHDVPHATEYVSEMVALVSELLDRGLAYVISDGVYLDTGQIDGYGLLALQDLDSLRAGARVEANEEKRSPLDFVLWKNAKPGEPSWPAPFGDGRPGWHTECVVMSLDLLGEGFDLHTGGQDLRFPHHENERAQAVAIGRTFAHHWMHHAFIELKGEKMSKSLGNVIDLVELIETYDPRAFRLLLLQSHYRSPMQVTSDSMRDAESALARLDSFARRFAAAREVEPDTDALARFRDRMDDDLDTPGAVAILFDLVRRANADDDQHAAAAAFAMCDAVGLVVYCDPDPIPEEVLAKARQRDDARAGNDWARADALRDELVAAGYAVEDTPTGTQIRPV